MSWKKPAMVFVNSMSDLFHDDVPFHFMEDVFIIMDICKWHTFQVLTKRPQRFLDFVEYWKVKYSADWSKIFPHVWVGVSIEDQAAADKRIPLLVQSPAVIKFLSCEPLLNAVDLKKHLQYYMQGFISYIQSGFQMNPIINWVIAGGESGPGARPMHPDWVRSLRDQCKHANIPFFFKQ